MPTTSSPEPPAPHDPPDPPGSSERAGRLGPTDRIRRIRLTDRIRRIGRIGSADPIGWIGRIRRDEPVDPLGRAGAALSSGPTTVRDRLTRAGRRALHTLIADLGTPADTGAPLFGTVQNRWLRTLPYFIAFVFTVALLPVTITVLAQNYGMSGALAGAVGTAQTAPLMLIVTRPLQAWWVIFAADVLGAVALLGAPPADGRPWPWTPMVIIGYLLLMAALALRERRRTLTAVWLATGAAGLVFEFGWPHRSDGTPVLLFVLSGVTLVVGSALRARGDAERRLAEQANISEAERARRTLLEERTRIARELHDVVAHHMSVITVQADSAPYRIGGLPREAEEEFGTIAATARESLTEMRRLLGVLRSEETERSGGPEKAPQPGLDQLPRLIEGTVRAGVPVELALPEKPVALPQAVDLSAYRIVQEALANVVRHAPGAHTRVSVTADGKRVIILVVNSAPPSTAPPLEVSGTGHGLVGMRERVRLLGGTLDTGPLPDGGFRVAARLPLVARVTAEEGAGAAGVHRVPPGMPDPTAPPDLPGSPTPAAPPNPTPTPTPPPTPTPDATPPDNSAKDSDPA